MEKACCNVKVTETEDGLRVDIQGEDLKEKAGAFFDKCCGEGSGKKGFNFCCGTDK